MRFGPRGRRNGAIWGAWKASLGRLWGALKASGAGFPRTRNVKNHVFYDGFWRFHVLAPVFTPMVAQAARVDTMGRQGSNL